jgi:predicted transcriptional regulator
MKDCVVQENNEKKMMEIHKKITEALKKNEETMLLKSFNKHELSYIRTMFLRELISIISYVVGDNILLALSQVV